MPNNPTAPKVKLNNAFDAQVMAMAAAIAKVGNVDEMLGSPTAVKLVEHIVGKIRDLDLYASVQKTRVFPYMNEQLAIRKKQYRTSAFRHALEFDIENRDEVYELVRLGYIGLFHKYEAFQKGLFDIMNDHYSHVIDGKLEDFIQQEFGLKKFNECWNTFECIWEANYITNSSKHYDGFPKPYPDKPERIPYRFRSHPLDKRISIEPNELYRDIASVREYILLFTNILQAVQAYRLAVDSHHMPFMQSVTGKARDKMDTGLAQMKEATHKLMKPFMDRSFDK